MGAVNRRVRADQLPFRGIDTVFRDVQTQVGNAEWFVIGALARDLIFLAESGKGGSRITQDVDIAVALPDWEAFTGLLERLESCGYQRAREPHRVLSPEKIALDVISFGAIAHPDGEIIWPPRYEVRLDVKGFNVLVKSSVAVQIDEDLVLQVASIPSQALLKIISWIDRRLQTSQDAEDFAELLSTYGEIEEARLFTDHADMFDDPDFDIQRASARMLGRESAGLAAHLGQPEVFNRLNAFVHEQGVLDQEHRFTREMGHAVRLEKALQLMHGFVTGWREGRRLQP